MAMSEALSICCIPVSWPSGLGELGRSLALAAALREAWPRARVHLVLNRDLPPRTRALVPESYTVTWLSTSPTCDDAGVRAALHACRPELVLFDNAGTWRQCRAASRGGARTVFISSRPQTRARGADPRWLAWLDEHWLIGPSALEGTPSARQRLAMRIAGTAVRAWQTLFTPSHPAQRARTRRAAGCADAPYICFVPGGGGGVIEGHSAMTLFADAAEAVARRTGRICVLLEGPLHQGHSPQRRGVTVQHVAHAQAIDLMSDAELVVVGAGSSLLHALAQLRVCVTTMTGGTDQALRAHTYAARGLAVATAPRADALADAACALLADAPRRNALRQRIVAAGLRNDLPHAVAALLRLVASPAGSAR